MNQKPNKSNNNSTIMVRTVTTSGLVIAACFVVMYLTQSFSFGQYQMRLSTSLYAMAAIYPFLIVPLGTANLLSNVFFSGLGAFDIIGGFVVGILTAVVCRYLRKISIWLVGISILVIPTLLVPIWYDAFATV